MKESEHKLKTILETADEGFQLVNTRQEIVDQNPAMCRIMGREKEDVIGKTIFDFVDEENKKIFLEQIERRKKGISSAYEVALSLPDGSHVHCLLNVSPLYDANNERIGAFAMVTDITERKKTEETLKESEQRVHTILNAINTGVIIIDPENRTIVDVNPEAARMIGLPKEEIVGHTCHQFICPREMHDCPVLDGEQAVENADRVLVTAAGKEVPILKTVTTVNLGGKAHLLESFIDITEQKEAETALRQAGNEQVAIFESLTLGIAFVKDRIILRGNSKLGELFGRSLDEMIGQTTRIWYQNEEEYLGIGASTYEDLKTKEVHQREQQLPRKDGSLFWCYFRVRAIDPNDISQGIVCVLEDVTERKRAEQELKERLDELEQFNRLVVGREIKMIGLKEEVNELLDQLGREEKYEIVQ